MSIMVPISSLTISNTCLLMMVVYKYGTQKMYMVQIGPHYSLHGPQFYTIHLPSLIFFESQMKYHIKSNLCLLYSITFSPNDGLLSKVILWEICLTAKKMVVVGLKPFFVVAKITTIIDSYYLVFVLCPFLCLYYSLCFVE